MVLVIEAGKFYHAPRIEAAILLSGGLRFDFPTPSASFNRVKGVHNQPTES
jgi:hypothetical protein